MPATRRAPRRSILAAVVAASVMVGTWLVSPTTPRAGAVARSTETVPSSIAADCSTDVTKALLKWIDSAPNGSTLSFASKGCYRVDGSLTIDNRSGLTFEGNGATIKAGTDGNRDRVHLWFRGGKNITVRDLIVRGANPHADATERAYVPTRAFQHGFCFRGVDGALLDRVQVYDVYGDFVYIGDNGDTGEWSHNIKIVDSKFDGSGRQGISVTGGDHVTIENNTIRNVGRSMFDLEPNNPTQGAEKILIQGNVTGAAKNFWIASKGSGSHIDFTVRNNTMKTKTGNLIWVYGVPDGYRGPVVIEDNKFIVGGTVNDESTKGAFFFAKVDGITIQGNKVVFPRGAGIPAVEIRDSKHLDVSGNQFVNAGKPLLDTSPAYPTPDQR